MISASDQLQQSSNIGYLSLGRVIQSKDKIIDLTKPKIMGILNLTPDSFSDGGKHNSLDTAIARIATMVAEEADIIDIGAESTRPGSTEISSQEEIDRLCPVLEKIKDQFPDTLISIDTSKPEVMEAVLKYNIHLINDVRALRERDDVRDSLEIVAKANIPVVLMHMQGKPRTMQREPKYENVVTDVYNFFQHRIDICKKYGIKHRNIILDPGFGFGKTWYDNASLLNYLYKFQDLQCPLLVGLSRKSMIERNNKGSVPVEERLPASIALAAMAVERGASIVRCHDVKQTKQAVDMAFAILEDGNCIDE